MIIVGTKLNIVDNSGGKIAKCIKIKYQVIDFNGSKYRTGAHFQAASVL